MTDSRLQGLYVITDGRSSNTDELVHKVELALDGGARIVQYRDKKPDQVQRRALEAQALADLCQQQDVLFIVNDDVQLAAQCGADGVHIGQDDAELARARESLGPKAIIGVTCYNDLRRAQAMTAAGADYIAYGRFFASRNKPDAVQASTELLAQSRKMLDIPVAAIGGITPHNGRELIQSGAHMLAVIDAVFGQTDITAACQGFSPCFSTL